jgi:glycosyltransferase involved in cell wall biosynthesis
MAGPAIRAFELARALANVCDVTLAAPAPSTAPGLRLVEARMADVETLVRTAREHDAVVAQELPPVVLERLRVPLVADLYNALVVELLEAGAKRATQRRIAARTLAMCAAADLILCANERQRDLLIGGLALHGLLDPETYARDPTLRSLVAVVPFGLPDGPAPQATGALRAAFPEIGDRVLIWGGGVWSWLDPETPIRALERLDPDVHLVIMGLGRPELAASGQAATAERLTDAARVHINRGWVPYAERGAWLAEADLAVSAHRDHLEARYAHRTRLLDAFWAGLPVVTTRGDALAELIEREGLGATVAPGDAEAYAEACARLLGPDGAAARERIAHVAPGLRWSTVTAPLVEWCARPAPRRAVRRDVVRRAALAQYRWALAETLGEEGPAAAARRVGRRLKRAFL